MAERSPPPGLQLSGFTPNDPSQLGELVEVLRPVSVPFRISELAVTSRDIDGAGPRHVEPGSDPGVYVACSRNHSTDGANSWLSVNASA
jgi:hypothetical protein